MAASPDRPRRRRYTRSTAEGPLAITPQRLTLLRQVARLRISSLPQLATLACLSQKRARRSLRALFDHGLVDVIAVPRVALADPGELNAPALLYGSAPNLYAITRAGLKVLEELGVVEDVPPPGRFGPRNSLFLAHELAVRDVRVWLELTARQYSGHSLEAWHDGAAAEVDLRRSLPPRKARPDAWFLYRLRERTLVGLLELDRGTERGSRRWGEKLQAYEALFASSRLREVTGYANARVLVVTFSARRRDLLANLIAKHAKTELAGRFWLAERSVLKSYDLNYQGWRQPGNPLLHSLVPAELVQS